MKRILAMVLLLVTATILIGCGSQEHFGQRKAPKDCNCTRWSR